MTIIIDWITDEDEKNKKMDALRCKAQSIVDYATNITAYCSYVSCFECPMNVNDEPNKITCLVNVKLIRHSKRNK